MSNVSGFLTRLSQRLAPTAGSPQTSAPVVRPRLGSRFEPGRFTNTGLSASSFADTSDGFDDTSGGDGIEPRGGLAAVGQDSQRQAPQRQDSQPQDSLPQDSHQWLAQQPTNRPARARDIQRPGPRQQPKPLPGLSDPVLASPEPAPAKPMGAPLARLSAPVVSQPSITPPPRPMATRQPDRAQPAADDSPREQHPAPGQPSGSARRESARRESARRESARRQLDLAPTLEHRGAPAQPIDPRAVIATAISPPPPVEPSPPPTPMPHRHEVSPASPSMASPSMASPRLASPSPASPGLASPSMAAPSVADGGHPPKTPGSIEQTRDRYPVDRSGQQHSEPPPVRIHIGRVELRAPTPKPPAATPPRPRATPRLSLDGYLSRRRSRSWR